MRRLLAWISGAIGGLAAYKLLTRRQAPVAELPPAGPDPRAEELRAKLAQQESVVDAATSVAEPEPPAPEPEPVAEDATPEERRARVHDEARAAVEQMRRTPRD